VVAVIKGVNADPAAFAEASAAFGQKVDELHALKTKLANDVEEFTQSWQGEASGAVKAAHEKWDEAFRSKTYALDDIGEELNETGKQYAGTDEDSGQGLDINWGETTFAHGPNTGDGDKSDDGKTSTEAAQPVDFKEKLPVKESPDDPSSQPSARDLDQGGPGSAHGDKSLGRGNDPVGGHPPQDAEYRIGSPQRPDLKNKDDFEYGSKEPNVHDEVEWAKWGAMNEGAEVLRPDLDDATDMYSHFRDNTGAPMKFDYEEAYREDDAIRANVNDKIAEAQRAAEGLIREGNTSFSMTGGATAAGNLFTGDGHYPSTEDWQKTIGAYNQWASGDVKVNGDTVTMTVTVHAEDCYNFNRNSADVASGLPDNANGRFEEIGWAKPFDTSGELTRTVTWKLGEGPGASSLGAPGPDRSNPEGADDPPTAPR
jgi:WXG100 family type VII secretion target